MNAVRSNTAHAQRGCMACLVTLCKDALLSKGAVERHRGRRVFLSLPAVRKISGLSTYGVVKGLAILEYEGVAACLPSVRLWTQGSKRGRYVGDGWFLREDWRERWEAIEDEPDFCRDGCYGRRA